MIAIGDRRPNKSTLRIVQYNVEWLFIDDDYYSSMKCPGPDCPWTNNNMAETHLNYVANIISKLNPDILNVCEIEGDQELQLILNKLNDAAYKAYFKQGGDSSTGQNVGMITKMDPIVNLYRYNDKRSYPMLQSHCGFNGASGQIGVSKHYITEFALNNNCKVAFIAAHLLAFPRKPKKCAKREAQALVLQQIISEYCQKGYEIILLGDFNDYDREVLDINRNMPTSSVLAILKGQHGTFAGTYQLYNVAEQLAMSNRYSNWRDSDNKCDTSSIQDYAMIDHILVSDGIKSKIKNVFIYHAEQHMHCNKYNSDHYPVVIDLLT